MVLNPNPLAGADLYAGRTAGGLLLGTRYALLRREFWPVQANPKRPPDTVRRLLITLGGTDPRQLTLPLAERLHDAHPELSLDLVCGAAPPAALVDFASGREQLRLHTAVGDMASLMVACDACVTAAGATLYELCVARRPFAVVVVAENQRLNAAWVEREDIGLSLGWHGSLDWDRLTERLSLWLADSATRVEQSRRAARRVDGFGARRVVEAMRRAAGPGGGEADGAST
jgi:spore coat polysaccharide biosynthesis predicted glycosyltransferase SpsG